MGVAVLSGVVDSLQSVARNQPAHPKWETHTPGTLTPVDTPTALHALDASLPSRYIACVSRQESAAKLRVTFSALGGLGETVEVRANDNVAAVREADVVLLW